MVIAGHIIFMTAYIYIYIYVYYMWYSFIHSINKHCPWKKWKKKKIRWYFSSFISFNYPFFSYLWVQLYTFLVHLGHIPQFRQTVETNIFSHWFDWSATSHLASNQVSLKCKKPSDGSDVLFLGVRRGKKAPNTPNHEQGHFEKNISLQFHIRIQWGLIHI